MKIQCSCGAKYAFDVTPEMVKRPIRFVCQKCGLDSSEYVNDLIRREFNAPPIKVTDVTPGAPPPPVAPPPKPIVRVTTTEPAAPKVEAPRLKVASAEAAPAPTEEKSDSPSSKYCPKHRRELVTHKCLVCEKPMCPECLKLFGYVCSPLCKAKAEAEKINIPVYAWQSSVREARFWRKTGAVFTALVALLVLAVGFWFWYAWFGSVPHPAFSIRFDDLAHSGAIQLVGKDQVIFLRSGTLARYDLKTKKQIWSQELVAKQQVTDAIAQADAVMAARSGKLERPPADAKRIELVKQELAAELELHVSGQNVWVGSREKLTHYNWDTGKEVMNVPVAYNFANLIFQGDEMLLVEEMTPGQKLLDHINLATGESRTEVIDQPVPGATGTIATTAGGTGNDANATKPLDPGKIAAQVQNMSLAGRIALPATVGNASHEQQIQAEIDSQDQTTPAGSRMSAVQRRQLRLARGTNYFTLVPSANGYIQFSVALVESHIITREAMKAPPKKSALNGDLNVTQTAEVANETLNEMQRNRGGNTVEEDESRYLVSLRRPDSADVADWSGEVIGPPSVLSLKTVNILTAGKTVIVFDKTNKRLWQAELTYKVSSGDLTSPFGEGPCVERGNTLYVFDQAVLTAFDLASGNARWRLPSVGVVGLFFDDQGILYVNTTTADPDTIRYSRQIDVTQKIEASLYKIDPQTGKTIWSTKPGGFISYLNGKFIYTIDIYDPGDEEDAVAAIAGITPNPPHVEIRRINPKNGQIMWKNYQERAPLNVQFNDNTIGFVFKKEVQVLKYLTF